MPFANMCNKLDWYFHRLNGRSRLWNFQPQNTSISTSIGLGISRVLEILTPLGELYFHFHRIAAPIQLQCSRYLWRYIFFLLPFLTGLALQPPIIYFTEWWSLVRMTFWLSSKSRLLSISSFVINPNAIVIHTKYWRKTSDDRIFICLFSEGARMGYLGESANGKH